MTARPTGGAKENVGSEGMSGFRLSKGMTAGCRIT